MIFYYEWQLQEAYDDYKETLPKASDLLDIESFRRNIYEPLINEIHDEQTD
tara:strand:+ start:285 stop:437 length:153 start_codon:yes stop_codon:yes gene_type:complete